MAVAVRTTRKDTNEAGLSKKPFLDIGRPNGSPWKSMEVQGSPLNSKFGHLKLSHSPTDPQLLTVLDYNNKNRASSLIGQSIPSRSRAVARTDSVRLLLIRTRKNTAEYYVRIDVSRARESLDPVQELRHEAHQ